jgi:uncharacterized protein GlcG (DUF336 family)
MHTRRLIAVSAATAALTAVAAAGLGAVVGAEPDPGAPPAPAGVAQLATVETATAQRIAQVALDACAAQGYAVTAAVVGRDSMLVALLRDETALPASVDSATGKARASAGFRQPSGNLGTAAKDNPGLLQMPGFVVLRGGLPIRSGEEVIGAIGVGGAPGGDIDEGCAQAGIDAVADEL